MNRLKAMKEELAKLSIASYVCIRELGPMWSSSDACFAVRV